MGNFSRDTFDPAKRYVAVRLQQGVPLVDADWNETNDVVRHELYDSLRTVIGEGVAGGSSDVSVVVLNPIGMPGEPILLLLQPGSAIVAGRPVRVLAPIPYNTQRWLDPAQAAADGVDVIPPPPPRDPGRVDLAYLDVWEREVDSHEDPDLVNPAIGVETSVRMKREAALRLAVGTTNLPVPSSGHAFLPLAVISTHMLPPTPNAQTTASDVRPVLGVNGVRTYDSSYVPAFLPVSLGGSERPNWHTQVGLLPTGALKPPGQFSVGMIPFRFADGARLVSLRLVGHIQESSVSFLMVRARQRHPITGEDIGILVSETISLSSGATERNFSSRFTIESDGDMNIVDNARYFYCLIAASSGTGATHIEGITVRYKS
jgi:hypothetical protein